MQWKHTWHVFRFRNQNPRHDETAPLLGESTPPQGVNSLILSDPYLPYPWWLLIGINLVVHPSQQALHQTRQPLIRLVVFGLLRLLLVVLWFVLPRFSILIGRNKLLLLPLMLRSLMLLWRSSARCSFPWWLLLDLQFLSMKESTLGSDVTN
jgi:hypothetical protein